MRVRGLKHDANDPLLDDMESHPMRVRGLKLLFRQAPNKIPTSHPMRVRGLKPQRLRHKDP